MNLENLKLKLRNDFYVCIRPYFIENKCYECGTTENLHLHHTKEFIILFQMTLKDLNIELKDEYNDDEVKLIRNYMLGLQMRHNRYITLCGDCHLNLEKYKESGKHRLEKRKADKGKSDSELEEIEKYLESLIGRKLYKEDRKELADKLNLKDSKGRKRTKLSLLNNYLIQNFYMKIDSVIVKEDDKRFRVWILDYLDER